MTTRSAELLMALLLGFLSLFLMWKSAELPVGWIQGEGPGGGAWPFWLAGVMLITCVITLVRWFLGQTPESRDTGLYMDAATVKINAITVGSLVALLAMTHVIGLYFAVLIFLLFYLRFVGRHTWRLTCLLAVGAPVFLFFFFEALLKIILPKGYSEPLFYPLYAIIY